jgi:hypothetical protein
VLRIFEKSAQGMKNEKSRVAEIYSAFECNGYVGVAPIVRNRATAPEYGRKDVEPTRRQDAKEMRDADASMAKLVTKVDGYLPPFTAIDRIRKNEKRTQICDTDFQCVRTPHRLEARVTVARTKMQNEPTACASLLAA